MRRLLLILVCMCFLAGCQDSQKRDEESMKNYEAFINAVTNNKGIQSTFIPFDYKLVEQKQNDGSYQYEVQISNPRVAMYDIQAIAVDPAVDSNTNIYPCISLVGDDAKQIYYMIPYQANPSLGYISMIGLNGVSKEKQFTLHVLVSWKDSSRANTYRAYFNCSFAEAAELEDIQDEQ